MSISLNTQIHPSRTSQFFHALTSGRWLQLAFCILFIVSVSIYDTYLVTVYRNGILMAERNPICLYLIRQDMSQLSWFIGGKVLGNMFVVGSLLALCRFGYRHTLTVAKGVALFQLSLLVFLHCSDSRTGLLHFDGIGSNVPTLFYPALWSLLIHLGVVLVVAVGVFCVKRKWELVRSAIR